MGNSFSGDTTSEERRSIWQFWPLRLVVFFSVLIFTYAGVQFATFAIAPKIPFLPKPIAALAFIVFGIAAVITLYRMLVQRLEKRNANELAADGAIGRFINGAVIGAVLFCAVIATIVFLHAGAITGFAGYGGVAIAFGLALLAGVAEEIIFRGVVYRLLEDGFGTLIAIILSGAFFGLIHAINPGATTASTIAIALEAGVLLAAAYAATRSLWLPIGLHFAWNFTEGGVFGTAVSGGTSHGLFNTVLNGPISLTGGKFGPEASIPAVAVCLVAALVFLGLTISRGAWKPLRFRLRA